MTMGSFDYFKVTRHKTMLAVLMSALVLVFFVIDISTGAGDISIKKILYFFWDADARSATMNIIVWDIRLPSALLAILVGAMLSAAGAQMQTILNNPLAEPFTLGISSAASFGAAMAIVVGANAFPFFESSLITISAFLFSLLTVLLLYLFTRLRGTSAETMVLIGIALYFGFHALLYMLQHMASDAQISQIVFWMMGSLNRADWFNVAVCGAVFLSILPVFIYRGWGLTALRMGDEKAASLGINVKRLRIEMLICVSLLTATAVSFTGTIGFVGLVGPHIARLLVGEQQRFFLPVAVLAGAIMMSLTSILSKTITPGVIYPVGIITALIGIPFFISLILSVRSRSWR